MTGEIRAIHSAVENAREAFTAIQAQQATPQTIMTMIAMRMEMKERMLMAGEIDCVVANGIADIVDDMENAIEACVVEYTVPTQNEVAQ